MRCNEFGEVLKMVAMVIEAQYALEAEWKALKWAYDIARRENWLHVM